MPVEIDQIEASQLADYARVPMALEVKSKLIVDEIDPSQFRQQSVENSYLKDYDAYPDGSPLNWPARFDLTHWGLWLARDGSQIIGSVAVARNTPQLDLLENQPDIAVLWDIRVDPSHQRRNIGAALFRQAAHWATSKGCRQLKIETQDVNVPACRFYQKMGCHLAHLDRAAYRHIPSLAHEIMLVWQINLPL